MQKLTFVLVAVATILTASAAYAGPHHWANGNWGGHHRTYAAQNGSGYGQGQGYARYHHRSSYMGQGLGQQAPGRGMGYGLNADGTCPYGYR